MKKILVTTDLSANSKPGLRFAINLAKQKKVELVFLFVHQVLRASTWTDVRYDFYVNEDKEKLMNELTSFVASVYKSMKVTPGKHSCAVYHEFNTVLGIREFAKKSQCDYICIATRGAGAIKRLFGTNTAKLINNSELPVICVPKSYRTKPITKLLYASDMSDYENELKQVVAFAKPLKAQVELMHLSYPYELEEEKQVAEKDLKKKLRYDISVHYETRDIELSLLSELERAVKKAKPSMMVMFTKQDRSFFDKVFLGSAAEEFSFVTNVPLLVFNKE